MKCEILINLILEFVLFIPRIGKCDVSHLQQSVFDPWNYFYGQPVHIPSPTATTTTVNPIPVLPEIIINKNFNSYNGYSYGTFGDNDKYLPPLPPPNHANDDGIQKPDLETTSSIPFPAIVIDDTQNGIKPPSEGYLPPFSGTKQRSNKYKKQQSTNSQDSVIVENGAHLFSIKHSGYNYDRPTSTTSTTKSPVSNPFHPDFLPPENDHTGYIYKPPIIPTTTFVPQKVPDNTYLPAVSPEIGRSPKDFDMFSVSSKSPIHLQISEMRCLETSVGNDINGYFKTIIKVNNPLTALPVLDNIDTSNLDGTSCNLKINRAHILVDIKGEDFIKCGIVKCPDSLLCLKIRFPLISGLRTAGDSILTLQCKVQERTVTKTHSFKMSLSSGLKARNSGVYAQGGSQQPFRTHVELLRKSANGFTHNVEPNSIVQLGEELQLRAYVQPGDGWNYTKLSDVNLQRVSTSGEILNSVTLIKSSGCVNPSLKAICPYPPIFYPPLGYKISFKAIMFEGMKNGEEILISVKMTGCLSQHDCYQPTSVNSNGQYEGCEQQGLDDDNRYRKIRNHLKGNPFIRTRRDVRERNNNSTFSEISTFTFRVQIPPDMSDRKFEENVLLNVTHGDSLRRTISNFEIYSTIASVIGCICILSVAIILIYLKS